MEVVTGKASEHLDEGAFQRLRAGYAHVLLDIGTGDGAYPYRYAREYPDTLCIGLDPNRDGMREYAARARRKPARGGLPNVLYVVGAIESPPRPLEGTADTVSVNFPWGSLLRGLILPDPAILGSLRRLAAPGCEVHILHNYAVLADPQTAAGLDIPVTDRAAAESRLRPAYEAAGFRVLDIQLIGARTPASTRWGQRLTRGSRRPVLSMRLAVC